MITAIQVKISQSVIIKITTFSTNDSVTILPENIMFTHLCFVCFFLLAFLSSVCFSFILYIVSYVDIGGQH